MTEVDSALEEITSMQPIKYFVNLVSLNLSNSGISRVEGLNDLNYLKELRLCENNIRYIHGLLHTPSLELLNFSNNSITRISGLHKLRNLRVLWLNENAITQLGGLEELSELQQLWLAGNQISKITPALHHLQKLEDLNLSMNPLSSFQEALALIPLHSLRILSFNDPHFGECPLCNLSNYLTFIIYHLPRIQCLDTITVSEEARAQARSYFVMKAMYYHMKIRSFKRSAQLALRQLGSIKQTKEAELWRKLGEFYKYVQCVRRELDERRQPRQAVCSPYTFEARSESNPLDALDQGSLLEALQSKYAQLMLRVNAEFHKVCRLDSLFSLLTGKLMSLQDEVIGHQLNEQQTGLNIRFEEGSPSDPWFASCCSLVYSRYFDSSLPIKVTRVARIHNRLLRHKFEDKLEEVANVASSGFKRNMDFLFYGYSRALPGEVHRAATQGFRNHLEYGDLRLPSCICLSYALDTAEVERVRSCREAYAEQSPAYWPAGQALLCKVYLGRAKGDLRVPFFSRGMSFADIWELCPIPKPNTCWAVYRTLDTDPKNRAWFIFDECLVLPEYLIQFEYIDNHPAAHSLNIVEELTPALDYIDLFSGESLENASALSTCAEVQAFPSIPTRSQLDFAREEVYREAAGCANDQEVNYLGVIGDTLTDLNWAGRLGNLMSLTICYNKIREIKGIRHLVQLRKLNASFNQISKLSGIEACEKLKKAELHHNQVDCISNIVKLMFLPLKSLSLFSNPISYKPRYPQLPRVLRHLRKFDWKPLFVPSGAPNFDVSLELVHENYSVRSELPQDSVDEIAERSDWFLYVDSLNLSNQRIVSLRGISILANLRVANFSQNFIKKIEDVEYCPALQELDLEDNVISSISGVSELRALTKLNLANNKLKDLSGLPESLEQLCIERNFINNLDLLRKCPLLMEVYASGNLITVYRRINCISSLEHLIILDLHDNPVMNDPNSRMVIVFNFPKLKLLDGLPVEIGEVLAATEYYEGRLNEEMLEARIGNQEVVEVRDMDLSELSLRSFDNMISGFMQLQHLNLSKNLMTSLNVIGSLPVLQKLDMSYNKVESFSSSTCRGLGAIPSIEMLDLSFNNLENLGPLQNFSLPCLRVLLISHNGINKFDYLSGLGNLRELDLSYNKIRKIENPVYLPELRFLRLEYNALRSLNCFNAFPALQMLTIDHNRIADIFEVEKLAELKELAELTLSNNPIAKKHAYRANIIKKLPTLVLLDREQVAVYEKDKVENPQEGNRSSHHHHTHKEPVKMSNVTFEDFIIPRSSPGEMRKRPSPFRK